MVPTYLKKVVCFLIVINICISASNRSTIIHSISRNSYYFPETAFQATCIRRRSSSVVVDMVNFYFVLITYLIKERSSNLCG